MVSTLLGFDGLSNTQIPTPVPRSLAVSVTSLPFGLNSASSSRAWLFNRATTVPFELFQYLVANPSAPWSIRRRLWD